MRNYLHKYKKVAKQQSKYRDLENRLPDSVRCIITCPQCLHYSVQVCSLPRLYKFVFHVNDNFSIILGKSKYHVEWNEYIEVFSCIDDVLSCFNQPSSIFGKYLLNRIKGRPTLHDRGQAYVFTSIDFDRVQLATYFLVQTTNSVIDL